jgi:hypothetical protein
MIVSNGVSKHFGMIFALENYKYIQKKNNYNFSNGKL